jgi:tripartite-type tricarboxylate transporter receptor subunit TctC
MKLYRFALLVAAPIATAAAADAQTWPVRPIKFVAPVSAGIGSDVMARMVADRISRGLGQQVFVENVPGAAGTLGTAAAARSAPDGYTFLLGTAGMLATNKFLFKSLPFDLDRDFTPVAIVCRGTPFAISSNPGLPVRSLPELIALAKSKPGKLSYAFDISSGWANIIGDLLNRRAGIQMVQVPYRTTPQAIADTVSGTTEVIISSVTSVEAFVQTGKLRRLAVTAAQRFPGMEDTPPVAEMFPGFVFEGWNAVVAPAKTDSGIVDRLNREIDVGTNDPEVANRLLKLGCLVRPGVGPQAAGEFLKMERERWAALAKELDLKPQ